MPEELTYSEAGVDRELRAESKKALSMLRKTYGFSRSGKVLQLPYGNIIPYGKNSYLDLQIEGVGTKVLLAQLAEKYDTIGIDGVAMAVNDVIRSGAKPLAISDNIHAQVSDPGLVEEWLKGVTKGAEESECVVPSGEIGDVGELIKGLAAGKGFDMVVAAIGIVASEKVVSGTKIKPNDCIIGLRSSGIHSNGITLARRVLFKQWGGKYEPHKVPEGLSREVVLEALEPTRIYVKPFLKVAEKVHVKAAVHITGEGYLKFDRLVNFSSGIGFEFDKFDPQPVFGVIQRAASELGRRVTNEEMFKTFNMGWGFAIIVNKRDSDAALDSLNKDGVGAEPIGRVTSIQGVKILYRGKKIILK